MSGDITRRQALTLGAIGAGVLVIGATGAGLSALQSESPALAPNPTGTEGAGGQGWNEPSRQVCEGIYQDSSKRRHQVKRMRKNE